MSRFSGWLLALTTVFFAVMLLGRLSHPLLWQDEGETVMLASRVVDHGYPKVHGERNVVYEFGPNVALGVKESVDAYIGKTWGDFYFAAPAVVWARATDDAYAQTFRLRLPFALAGAAGLALLLGAVLPALPPTRRRGFAATFLAICGVSISLLLHLREARYYPLLMAALGGMLFLHLREERLDATRRRSGWRGRALLQSLVSFLLFQVFHVAWFALTGLLAADRVRQAWAADPAERGSRLLRGLAPHALAVVWVAPWLVFFETFQVARGFASHLGLSPADYLANVSQVAGHFLRHELLGPALFTLAAGAWLQRREPEVPVPAHDLALRLAVFCLVYVAVGCLNPLVYERYFFVLGPLVTLVFLLEAWSLVDRAGARRDLAIGALVAVGLLGMGPRIDAVAGRLGELHTPVRGPVDFIVAHLKQRSPDPASLVIATNYEAHPLMWYLGSRVIVGLAGNNLVEDRTLTPDVVIPRRRWPRMLPELNRFLARADYEEVRLPVADVHYNTIAALSASPTTPDPHRFVTPHAEGAAALRVYHLRGGL